MGLPEDDVSLKLNGWSTYTIHYSIVQQAPFFQIHTDPTLEFRLQSNGEGSKEITPIRPVAILPGGISCEADKFYRLMWVHAGAMRIFCVDLILEPKKMLKYYAFCKPVSHILWLMLRFNKLQCVIMFNYCYRTYAGHLIWDLGLAHTSHLSLTEMSVPKQCALCVRRSFGAMPCWKLWKRNRRTPLGIFGKKCQGCCYWNASTKYRSCMPQTGIKKIRKVSAFLQGFWFKARPKNLTVPDRNQSWFSLGAWLRFQCLNLLMMMTFLAAKLGTSRLAGSSVFLTTATC